MLMATNIRHQLKDLCAKNGVPTMTAGNDCSEKIRKALLSGLFLNVAEQVAKGKYQTVSELSHFLCKTLKNVTFLLYVHVTVLFPLV